MAGGDNYGAATDPTADSSEVRGAAARFPIQTVQQRLSYRPKNQPRTDQRPEAEAEDPLSYCSPPLLSAWYYASHPWLTNPPGLVRLFWLPPLDGRLSRSPIASAALCKRYGRSMMRAALLRLLNRRWRLCSPLSVVAKISLVREVGCSGRWAGGAARPPAARSRQSVCARSSTMCERSSWAPELFLLNVGESARWRKKAPGRHCREVRAFFFEKGKQA